MEKSYELTLKIYKVTANFPKSEQYGLSAQMKRAAVSIPSNIAEGYYRQHTNEYIQFLSIAYGSLAEIETQTLLSKDLNLIHEKDFLEIESAQQEIGKMLFSLIRSLKNK